MSDFFTKKQRKFWCDTCKLFIEYTKISIDQHQRSKNHLRLVNQDIEYKNQKAKFQKLHSMYDLEQNQNTNINQSINGNFSISQQNKKIEQLDPMSNYLPRNMNDKNLLNNKTERNNFINKNTNMTTDQNRIGGNSHGLNSILLEEIKKEKIKSEIKEKKLANYQNMTYPNNQLNQINPWCVYWDYNFNIPFYFNQITRQSQWEKPSDYDYVINNQGPQQNLNEEKIKNYEIFTKKDDESDDDIEERESSGDENYSDKRENEGIIGKWEVVEKNQSIFKTKINDENLDSNDKPIEDVEEDKKEEFEEKKEDDYYLPGLINRNEFLYNEYGSDQEEKENEEDEFIDRTVLENIENLEARNEKEGENNLLEKDKNIDKNEKRGSDLSNKTTPIFENLSRDEIIDINKKLKQRDFDFRYMDLKEKEQHGQELNEPISIEMKAVNFKKPRIKKNNFFNDEE